MAYKISGRVLQVGNPIAFTSTRGTQYIKRDLVITVRKFDQYTGQPTDDEGNTPKFTFFGERGRDIDRFKPGDIVTVNFEISGRWYEKDGRIEYATDVRPLGVDFCRQLNQPTTYTQNVQKSEYVQPAPQTDKPMPIQTDNTEYPAETEELPF